MIGLSGDADVKGRKPSQTGVVNGWRCRYDLQTGKFDVPALFPSQNAKACGAGVSGPRCRSAYDSSVSDE